jgi:hypothetical protein
MISLAFLLFAYTPLPWILALCLSLYRHDLSQLIRPLKDGRSVVMWKKVFLELGIPLSIENSNQGKKTRPNTLARFNHLFSIASEKYPTLGFHLLVLSMVLGCSLISSFLVEPLFLPGDSNSNRGSFLIPCVLQLLSAIPSTLSMQRHFGPFPIGPYKVHLRKRRPGSLLRYSKSIFE